MISIQTNLSAGLIARQLSSTKRQFHTNLERLSTGLRLNRPDDSPGQFGLVINQNLQIQALNQGIINAQNGAGMLQTAQEGINSLIEILNQAYGLTVTAADASLTPTQHQQAQDEVVSIGNLADGFLSAPAGKTDKVALRPICVSGRLPLCPPGFILPYYLGHTCRVISSTVAPTLYTRGEMV